MKRYNVAILGATGAVGREMMKVLEERQFPIAQLKLLASEPQRRKDHPVQWKRTDHRGGARRQL